MNENQVIKEEEYRPVIELNENGTPDPLSLAVGAYRVLEHRNGLDLAVLHVGEKIDMADYFVLATAQSATHVRALTDEVEYRLGLCGIKADRCEGRGSDNSWIVVDYGNVVVHVFSREARKFYSLDKLFSDAAAVAVPEE